MKASMVSRPHSKSRFQQEAFSGVPLTYAIACTVKGGLCLAKLTASL